MAVLVAIILVGVAIAMAGAGVGWGAWGAFVAIGGGALMLSFAADGA